MKKNILLVTLLLGLFASAGFSQREAKLAKDFDSYSKMYQEGKTKMVRSHKDFIAYAKSNPVFKKLVKKEQLKAFLKELKFSKIGLVTCSFQMYNGMLQKQQQTIFDVTAKMLGWDPIILAADHKGYQCGGKSTCVASEDYICLGKSCGESILQGPDFQPEVLMP